MKTDFLPWSTRVLDILELPPKLKFMVWLWIVTDRTIWFGLGACFAGGLFYWLYK